MRIKTKLALLILAILGGTTGHCQGSLHVEAATGGFKTINADLKREIAYSLEAGLRGRYVFQEFYFGAETGVGRFNRAVINTEWIDVGFTRQFLDEKIRIDFGGGMGYISLSEPGSSAGLSSHVSYIHVGPFLASDFEFKRIALRVIAPLKSNYEARAALGFKIL